MVCLPFHLPCCLQLEEELEALAQAVLELAGSSAGGGAAGPRAPSGGEEGGDIVLEFGSPQKPATAGQVGLTRWLVVDRHPLRSPVLLLRRARP